MIIKLNAIDSTNAFLKRLNKEKSLDDYTIVTAKKQTEGRGQRGAYWQTKPGKNLIMSVFKRLPALEGELQFFLSMAVSMAVVRTLEHFKVADVKVKWPNDILSANKKICGILIETYIKSGVMDTAIIGIGLNINQTEFPGLLRATSMKNEVDEDLEIDQIRDYLISQLKYFEQLLANKTLRNDLSVLYHTYLFRILKPSTFENEHGSRFMGFITGVGANGKLKIRLEEAVIKEFGIKEVKLLY
jgi:BirA family biotin operon repressor/biotin-[acetyl-CoA-carboxylase] ligase